jgi:L-alanine-DL-glutamate epimerase-like enolase superfamily enzyme
VRVIGPDPADVGGLAELKWIAEHAYMHSILMAPHGTANGLLGLGALINVCATLPANYVAFEYPSASDPWWEDLVIGLPSRIVNDSMVDLLEAPGLGLDIDAEGAKKYLREEDAGFFD